MFTVVSGLAAAISAGAAFYAASQISGSSKQTDAAINRMADVAVATKEEANALRTEVSAVKDQTAKIGKQAAAALKQAESTAIIAENSGEEASALNAQTQIAKDDQRPWVTIRLSTNSPFQSFLQPVHDSFMPINVTLKKIGHAPAYNVRVLVLGYLVYGNHTDVVGEATKRCEAFRKPDLSNPAEGQVLFPGEEQHDGDGRSLGTPAIGFISPEIEQGTVTTPAGLRYIQPSLFACVDYTFGTPRTHHQSGVIYSLWHVERHDGHETINPNFDITQPLYPPEDIRLIQIPSENWRTD